MNSKSHIVESFQELVVGFERPGEVLAEGSSDDFYRLHV